MQPRNEECQVVSLTGTEDWDLDPLAAAAGPGAVFVAREWCRELAAVIAAWLTDTGWRGRWSVVTDEPEGWLAVVVPARTDAPCPACISWRIHNSPIRRLSREVGTSQPVRALRRSPHELREVGRWIAEQADPGAAVLKHWPQLSWWGRQDVPRHEWIWREPWCPECGRHDGPIEGDVDAAAIVQHHHDHAGPWGGVFSESVTAGTRHSPNVVLNVTARGDGRGLPNARDRASGKGRTARESATSALGECTERRAITAPAPWLRVVRNSRDAMLATDRRTLPFHELEPFSDEQWAEREEINAAGHAHYKIPLGRPDDETVLDWCEGVDLVTGEPVWLPVDHVYYRPGIPRSHFTPDSNGAAAGRSWADAACRGFRELAERDAWCGWWYGIETRPGLPLALDPWCVKVAGDLAGYGRTVHLLDLTVYPELPVVLAVGALTEPMAGGAWKGGRDIVPGAGCAPTYAEAARRAVGEVVQCAMLGRSPEQRMAYHLNDPAAREAVGWEKEGQPWLWPDGEHLPEDPPEPDGGWLDAYAALAEGWDSPLVVTDLTPGRWELPVVKAVCPHLRHFWPRLAHPRWPDGPGNVPVWL